MAMNQPLFSGHTRSHSSDKRIRAVAGCVMVACLAIVVRLFDRAVLQNGLAQVKALAQQEVTVKQNPFRGNIYAHGTNGDQDTIIALNEPKNAVSVIPRNVKDARQVAQKLSPLIGMKEQEIFDKINNDKAYIPPLKHGISLDVGEKIKQLNLAGVSVALESYRAYPEGSMAAQVLGFVNAEGNGQGGIEGYFNTILQGFSTDLKGERDGWGNTFIDTASISDTKGADVVLTIDRDVQVTVEQKLKDAIEKFKAKSGSVVIVDPKTGAVLAMANEPTYDPNAYNQVKAEDQNVFQNRAIYRAFEPGSVMKTMTIAAGLDSGKLKTTDKATYGSSVSIDGFDIHTAQNKSFGTETPGDALRNSDNVALADYGVNKIGRELLRDYMDRFGFGKKTGIDLDSESTGFMPVLKDWRNTTTANISFGQGMLVTPLQMTMAYAAIANHGMYMKPYTTESITFSDGRKESFQPKQGGQVVGEQAVRDVIPMLIDVVVNGHGKRAGVAGYTVAGKTGTAQIANIDGPGYQEGKNNGSFAGFAPVEDPKFAMFVTLEEPQGVEFAESSAAPLWGDIASYLLKNHFHVTPKQQ